MLHCKIDDAVKQCSLSQSTIENFATLRDTEQSSHVGLYALCLQQRNYYCSIIGKWYDADDRVLYCYRYLFSCSIAVCESRSRDIELKSRYALFRTHEVEAFRNISSPLCTLAILWSLCKILQKSSQLGNPSIGGVKRRRGSKLERCWTYRMLYLINDTIKIDASTIATVCCTVVAVHLR